jgi:hypothetical protein
LDIIQALHLRFLHEDLGNYNHCIHSISGKHYNNSNFNCSLSKLTRERNTTFLQYGPGVITILATLVNWLKGSALEIGKLIREPLSYAGGDNRLAYVLEIKRKWGKDRPKGCQGHLKLENTDVIHSEFGNISMPLPSFCL